MMEQAPIETVQPAIRMLSDAQIEAVHDSSLDILARTGIEMRSDAGRDLLLEAGAHESGGRITIPEIRVMKANIKETIMIIMYETIKRARRLIVLSIIAAVTSKSLITGY